MHILNATRCNLPSCQKSVSETYVYLDLHGNADLLFLLLLFFFFLFFCSGHHSDNAISQDRLFGE